VKNPDIIANSEGMKILFNAIIDPNFEDSYQSITYSLLLLLNNPNTRALLGRQLDFPQAFSVLTNTLFEVDKDQLEQAKQVIIILLKS
jgi:hypothetical protein